MQSISLKNFLYSLGESTSNGRRFCFILGAGASKESGIRTGVELARLWHSELLQKYTPQELTERARQIGIDNIDAAHENYSDMFYLRFHPDFENGYSFIEREMEQAQPSFGYYPLAMHLASTHNNLVITTNFDSLVEDALFIYTQKKPLVAPHEMLASYVSKNLSRPIVAKVHRGLFFSPFNKPEQVQELPEGWASVLRSVLKEYTPIVIGYAGGDGSLMGFLSNANIKMQGLYWCHMQNEVPSANIQQLVQDKNGSFVPIAGFDEMMFLLGDTFNYPNPEADILEVANQRVQIYHQKVAQFREKIKAIANPTTAQNEVLQSLERQYSQRLQELAERIAKNPVDADAYFRRANLYANLAKYTNAVADYGKVLEIWPDYATAYSLRADAFDALEQYSRAFSDYSAAIELDPDEAYFHFLQAVLHDKLKNYSSALKSYNKALELDPFEPEYYYFRGYAHEMLNDDTSAMSDYSAAIGLDGDEPYYYFVRAGVYSRLGQQAKALADYTRALELKPQDEALLKLLASAMDGATPKIE